MRPILFRFALLVLILVILLGGQVEGGRHVRRQWLNLDDCDSSITLRISPEGNRVRLTWQNLPNVSHWTIFRADSPGLANMEVVGESSDTTWMESEEVLLNLSRAFYRVSAYWYSGDPNNYSIIEDFDEQAQISSYSNQDLEPNAWRWVDDGLLNPNGWALELYGNSWKRETINAVPIHAGTVWRIGAKSFTSGELQAFGIADTANEMWYSLWGREIRYSEAWISIYHGWYNDSVWEQIDLPVGDDWYGRFGYFPSVTALLFANDNDTIHIDGKWRIDEIRDVTGAISLPPTARFRWEIRSYPTPDTMEVAFCSMGCDPDGPVLTQFWTLGDAKSFWGANPIHRYRAQSTYPVSLTIIDSAGRPDWVVGTVSDSVFTATREISLLFVGDVMLARRYEDQGGIIPTRGVRAIFQPTQNFTSSFDLAMCNLESPLTNATEHHPTKSYTFKGRPQNVDGLRYAGFDFCALGNNHNFDYLEEGMRETKHLLDSVGILATGAGLNDELARLPIFFGKNGLRIAILSFCNRDGTQDNEQPFLAAAPDRPGFAMWDRTNIETMIPMVRASADFVIVSVHSGTEYAAAPPLFLNEGIQPYDEENFVALDLLPDTSDIALRHLAIDLGADLIVNHHPHVIQGCEFYQGKLIAHSMGNFAFDQQLPETFISMAIESRITGGTGIHNFIVHPIYIDRYIPGIPRGELAGSILDYISDLSRPLATWVVRQTGVETAMIIPDTMTQRTGANYADTLFLVTRGGYAESAPFLMRGGGYTAWVNSPMGTESRVGREVLLHGNMENEGATPWDLNSNYERYDSTTAYRGQRSIRLNRSGGGSNSVSTILLYRPPYDLNYGYSLLGWILGSNCSDTRLDINYFDRRTGGDSLAFRSIGGARSGTFAWTQVWEDLTPPQNTYFFNLRVNLRSPSSGEGRAWFDDIRLVKWEAWHTGTNNLGFPNNAFYTQVRAPLGTPYVIITYRKEWTSVYSQ